VGGYIFESRQELLCGNFCEYPIKYVSSSVDPSVSQ
jgi:hypothetical protein